LITKALLQLALLLVACNDSWRHNGGTLNEPVYLKRAHSMHLF